MRCRMCALYTTTRTGSLLNYSLFRKIKERETQIKWKKGVKPSESKRK